MKKSNDQNLLVEMIKDLHSDVRDIKKDLTNIKITQAEQAIILTEHQKCSATNSERLTKVEEVIIPELIKKFTPKKINWKANIAWTVGIVGTLITAYCKIKGLF